MKKNNKDGSYNSNYIQEPYYSDDDVTVDGDNIFLRITKTIMYAAMI